MQVFDKIKTMNISEMKDYFQQIFDSNEEIFGCGSCIDYGTHHYPKDCIRTNCEWVKIGTSIKAWLESEFTPQSNHKQ